jgi:hypothetical protein
VAKIIEEEFNMKLIFWSVDTKDFEKSVSDSLRYVRSQLSKMFGKKNQYYDSVILLSHDYKFEAATMDKMIREFENQGLEMCTPVECFGPKIYYVNEDD